MKKVLLIAAVAVFGFANAQETSFGVKAGANLANIVGDEADGDMRFSFHIGGVAEIPLAQDFVFGPELLYSSQGSKSSSEETFAGVVVKEELVAKLDYVQIPLMAKYYVADGFSLELGPQIGFLVSAKVDYEVSASGNGINESESEEIDIKDEVSGLDYGLNVGIGYKLESGLFFQGRYNIGLANINDFEGSDDFKNQNSVIQFSVGFMF